MGEIAAAYVRIRPNMAGFRSETQAGVKSAFSGVGKIVGLAFSGIVAGEIVKSAVGAAASLQKQVEAVRFEFGRTSKELIGFANTTGVAMGAVEDDTLKASSAFGRIFRNIGIGGPLAAQMTKRFELLALSINSIRGGSSADAASLLNSVALAAAGNTRGLKQLGIVADTASIKQAYFAMTGRHVLGTLNAQQKAIGIYALATRNLPKYLAEARKHSGDLADVQAHLTAEWAKAKAELGSALLPAVTRGTRVLANWLARMNKSGRLSRDFAIGAHIAATAVHAVFAVVRAAVNVFKGFSKAVGGGRHALVILAAAFAVNKIRKFGAAIRNDVNAALAQTRASARQTAATVKTTSAESATAIKSAAVKGEAASTGLWTSMKAGAISTAITIKGALISTGIGALVLAIGLAVAYIFTHWDQVKRWTSALGAVMAQIWRGIKEIIVGAAKAIGGGIVAFMIYPMKEFIDVAAKATGWIPYVGDGVSSAAKAVDGLYESMKRLASDGKNEVVQGARDLGGVGKAWTDSMAKSAIKPTQKKKLKDAGKGAAVAFADGFKGGVSDGVSGIAKSLNAALKATIEQAHARIRSSIQDAKDNLVRIGSDLAKTIDEIKAKMGGAAGSLAGSPQGKAFAKLKKLIEGGAPSFEIARARDELASQLTGVGKATKTPAQHELADLTSTFNQGKITYAQFTNRLHKVLHENGISLAAALKTGGKAFVETYRAQVAALGKQAAAINAVPKSLRNVGGAGGAADIRIVQPMKVIAAEQMKVRLATQKVAAKIAAAEAKAESQRTRQINSLHDLQRGSSHAAKQRTAALHESKRHTRLLARIAAEHRRARLTSAPKGPIAPPGWTRKNGVGPQGNTGSPGSSPGPGARVGPSGPHGPVAAAAPVVAATRNSASTVRDAIATHRGAVIRALGALGLRFEASERHLLAAELKIVEPLDRLRADQARIGAHASQQRERLIRSSDRTNTLLRKMAQHGKPPGYDKQPKGKGSHDARQATVVGSSA